MQSKDKKKYNLALVIFSQAITIMYKALRCGLHHEQETVTLEI